MEISSGNHCSIVSKHKWVVRYCIRFNYQNVGGVSQLVEAGTHNLRLAAKTIGILHTVIALGMRGPDGTALEQLTVILSHVDLAHLATHCMNARIEWAVTSACGINC